LTGWNSGWRGKAGALIAGRLRLALPARLGAGRVVAKVRIGHVDRARQEAANFPLNGGVTRLLALPPAMFEVLGTEAAGEARWRPTPKRVWSGESGLKWLSVHVSGTAVVKAVAAHPAIVVSEDEAKLHPFVPA
jgi:hypothetical protein